MAHEISEVNTISISLFLLCAKLLMSMVALKSRNYPPHYSVETLSRVEITYPELHNNSSWGKSHSNPGYFIPNSVFSDYPSLITTMPGLFPFFRWCAYNCIYFCGIWSEKCPSWTQTFEHLVPNWWHCLVRSYGEIMSLRAGFGYL